MTFENLTLNLTNTALEELTIRIANLTTLFQAIGGLVILYLIFNVINAIMNRKKDRRLKELNESLDEIKSLLKKGFKIK